MLGDVRLADNIAVGANAVVNKSFDEENIAIAGVPAKKYLIMEEKFGRALKKERRNNVDTNKIRVGGVNYGWMN